MGRVVYAQHRFLQRRGDEPQPQAALDIGQPRKSLVEDFRERPRRYPKSENDQCAILLRSLRSEPLTLHEILDRNRNPDVADDRMVKYIAGLLLALEQSGFVARLPSYRRSTVSVRRVSAWFAVAEPPDAPYPTRLVSVWFPWPGEPIENIPPPIDEPIGVPPAATLAAYWRAENRRRWSDYLRAHGVDVQVLSWSDTATDCPRMTARDLRALLDEWDPFERDHQETALELVEFVRDLRTRLRGAAS